MLPAPAHQTKRGTAQTLMEVLAEHGHDVHDAYCAAEANKRSARPQPSAIDMLMHTTEMQIQQTRAVQQMFLAIYNYARVMTARGEGDADNHTDSE